MAALRNYGLLKFFEVPGMRAQPGLLRYIVELWDVDQRFFRVGDETLTLEIDDIYFFMGLLRRGAPINLVGKRPSAVSTEALLAEHGAQGVILKGGKISIVDIGNLPLKACIVLPGWQGVLRAIRFLGHRCCMPSNAWNPTYSTGAMVYYGTYIRS